MSVKKKIDVVYVAAIPKEQSGIGQDVPAHVVLEWRDKQGRRVHHHMNMTALEVAEIAAVDNAAAEDLFDLGD